MAIQNITLGTAPTGAGGDTFRSAATKIQSNFSTTENAASRIVGINDGNVLQVGAFGLGKAATPQLKSFVSQGCCFFKVGVDGGSTAIPDYVTGFESVWASGTESWQLFCGVAATTNLGFRKSTNGAWQAPLYLRHTGNTTVDSNGFIKNASPIVQLFADKIEPNEEALDQEPLFEKINTGHYLIKNTKGFSDNGWYIEMPKDANGNVLVAVQYQQLEDNTIEVKTFTKKFDEESGDIAPNIDKPRDIPVGRWIDLRLKELPKPEIEVINEPEQ